jgi:hypothetical protein
MTRLPNSANLIYPMKIKRAALPLFLTLLN